MAYTKDNLVEDLAELDVIFSTKKAARETVEFIIEKVKSNVVAGNQVNLSGLCSFKPAVQAEKTGKVPGTNTNYTSPAKNVVRITPSASFKASVAG